MTLQGIVIIVLSLLLICATAYGLYIKRKDKDYTRERYAFAALAAVINLVGIGIAATTARKTPLSALREFWAFITGSPAPAAPEPLAFAEQALILIFIAFVIYVIHRTFVTWGGAVSVEDKQRQDIHEERAWV